MEIKLSNIIMYISFLLWFIYLFLDTIKITIKENNMEMKYSKFIKKNIFKVLRIDKLLLIIVYIIYTTFKNESVNIYLFFIMILYFLVNLLYEDVSIKKINLINEKMNIIFTIFIGIIPLLYFLISKNITYTFIGMFIIFFLWDILLIIPSLMRKKKNGSL